MFSSLYRMSAGRFRDAKYIAETDTDLFVFPNGENPSMEMENTSRSSSFGP